MERSSQWLMQCRVLLQHSTALPLLVAAGAGLLMEHPVLEMAQQGVLVEAGQGTQMLQLAGQETLPWLARHREAMVVITVLILLPILLVAVAVLVE